MDSTSSRLAFTPQLHRQQQHGEDYERQRVRQKTQGDGIARRRVHVFVF